jgi:hypothetical protein
VSIEQFEEGSNDRLFVLWNRMSSGSYFPGPVRFHRRVTWTLDDLATEVNPVMRGWLAYYAAFYPTAAKPLCHRVDRHLVRWARWKYKRLRQGNRKARTWLQGVHSREPELFAHWRYCAPADN